MSVRNYQSINSCLMTAIQLKEQDDFGLSKPSNSHNYYHEYCRLYYANVVLTSQMKQLVSQRDGLLRKIQKIQNDDELDSNEQKLRRHRRPANLINRHFRCEVETCQKSYGSEGSLSQHLRLKHPEIYSEISEKTQETKVKPM